MTRTFERLGRIRWLSVAAFSTWLFLFGTTYGYLPALEHAWGLNLLRYLPDWAAWLLTALALLMTADEARRGVISAALRLQRAWQALPGAARALLGFGLAFATCWGLRDRVTAGDAKLLASVLLAPGRAAYPEPGAVWLLSKLFDLGQWLGTPGLDLPRAGICLAAASAVCWIVLAARRAAPDGSASVSIPVLALTGGVGAALAGRLDIQAFVVAAAAAYLFTGLRFLADGRQPAWPAAALGIWVWLEPNALLVLPSLVLLLRGSGRATLVRGVGIALAPLAVHLAYLVAVDPKGLPATTILHRGLGSMRGWVRAPWTGASVGTDYRLASFGHLKYLLNAGFVLAGGATVALLFGALRARARADRERLAAGPQLRFLASVWAGTVVASLLARPVWGPWDWEVFATTGLATAFLAGAVLSATCGDALRRQIVVAIAALQIAFVSAPLVAIGFGPHVVAGPLVEKRFDGQLFRRDRKPAPRIAPWL